MVTDKKAHMSADKLIHKTAVGMTDFEGNPEVFLERLYTMVRLYADAERDEKLFGQISDDEAVRHVISALCQKTCSNGAAVFHGLMRQILEADAVLLDIVVGLHRDLYAAEQVDEITACERKALRRVENILNG